MFHSFSSLQAGGDEHIYGFKFSIAWDLICSQATFIGVGQAQDLRIPLTMAETSNLSKKLRSRTSSMMLGETSGTEQDLQANPSNTRVRLINKQTGYYEFQAAVLESIRTRTIAYRFPELGELEPRVSMHVWNDFQPGKKPIVELHRIKNTAELLQFAAQTLIEVRSKVSLQTIGKLMNLAFNLRDGAGAYVFDELEPELVDIINSREAIELCNASVYPPVEPDVEFITDDDNEDVMLNTANSCCFVAASYLRMLSRNAENYVQIETNLRERYLNLYRRPLGVYNFHPMLQTAQYIKSVFGANSIIQNTLYALLYAGEESTNGNKIKDFLYRTHISHAGLHCYVLFVKVSQAYKISSEDLINTLRSKFYERELNALRSLMNECILTPCNGKIRKMWKYARIFDSKFCSELQTKKCPSFTATLAWMLKMEAPIENKDVMQITYIRNMPEHAMDFCRKYAKIARDFLLSKK